MRNTDKNFPKAEWEKRRRGINLTFLFRMFLILFAVFSLFLVLLIRVWFSSKAVELAYEVERLTTEKETIEEGNRRLSLEIAELRSPDRIDRIATEKFKMLRSPDAKVVDLER